MNLKNLRASGSNDALNFNEVFLLLILVKCVYSNEVSIFNESENKLEVYIAGSRGLVGSALTRNAPNSANIFTTERHELDLLNCKEVEKYFVRHQIDSVVLAAAQVGGIHANSTQQYKFLLENLKLQNSVIEAAVTAGVKNLVFLGSSCIYPKYAEQPIKEEYLLSGKLEETNEGYAIAKIAGVRLCRAIYDQFGFNYFSLMPSNMYGPNDNFHKKYSHVPAALMRRMHEAKIHQESTVEVWGDGSPRREFMHVDDFSRSIWYFLNIDLKGELLNIGTGTDLSIREFALKMKEIVAYQGDIVFNQEKPNGVHQKILDIQKAKAYGWEAQITLTDGLQRTYEWFERAYEKGAIRGL
jgi:GDP-L-fucose synthase